MLLNISINAAAAQALFAVGKKVTSIARSFGVHASTVYRWLKRDPDVVAARREKAEVKKRRRLVKRLAETKFKNSDNIVFPKYPSSTAIRDALRSLHHLPVTARTVREDLRAVGLVCRVRKKVPTRDPAVIRKRLLFCKGITKAMIKRMVFSDEHVQSSNDYSNRTMWVRPNAATIPRNRTDPRNVPRVQVWAAIGWNYKSKLVIFPKNGKPRAGAAWNATTQAWRLNADRYKLKCLAPMIKDFERDHTLRNRIFMQDNARAHIATRVQTYCKRKGLNLLEGWPPYSPDCNCIENLWAMMKKRVSEQQPTTEDELIRAINKFWNELTFAEINRYVAGFEQKVKRTIEKGGKP